MSGRTFLEQGQGSIEEKAGKFLFRQALYLLKSVAVGGNARVPGSAQKATPKLSAEKGALNVTESLHSPLPSH